MMRCVTAAVHALSTPHCPDWRSHSAVDGDLAAPEDRPFSDRDGTVNSGIGAPSPSGIRDTRDRSRQLDRRKWSMTLAYGSRRSRPDACQRFQAASSAFVLRWNTVGSILYALLDGEGFQSFHLMFGFPPANGAECQSHLTLVCSTREPPIRRS